MEDLWMALVLWAVASMILGLIIGKFIDRPDDPDEY